MIQHNLRRFVCSIILVGLSVAGSDVSAQLPQTRLHAVWPAGAQMGQEFELTVAAGADLEEITRLRFSDERITAKLKSTNVFLVKIPNDMPAGIQEVRCGGLWGFSNPRRFMVSREPSVFETGNNNFVEKANNVALNSILNGRLESGNDVDWFRFGAKSGQRVVIDCWAERLDSRMNPVISVYDSSGRRRLNWSRNSIGDDPVLIFEAPADGDYTVKVHDVTYRNGNEYFYRLKVHTGPHLEFAWPPTAKRGETSTITLFGYNLPGSQRTNQQINGVALESLEVNVDVPENPDELDVENRVSPVAAGTDVFSYRFNSGNQISNPIRIGVASTDVIIESEPNQEGSQAQQVSVPISIGGQFGQSADSDAFRFEAKKGEVWMIEAQSERLGTTADPFLIVNQITKSSDGNETVKRLTAQDDVGTNLLDNVFETQSDDPVFRLSVPADGVYEVILRDRYWESRGHSQLRYSLAIRPEQQDFRVVAVPSAPTAGQTWPTSLRKGDQFPVTLLAYRKDGFKGPIEVSAVGLPDGLICPNSVIATGEASSAIVITANEDAPTGLHEIEFLAKATVFSPKTSARIDVAKQSLDQAKQPLIELRKKVETSKANLIKPQAALDAALAAKSEQPNNENLKNLVTVAQKAVDDLQAIHVQAVNAVQVAERNVKSANEALTQAEQEHKSATNVSHMARTGTVVWSLNGNNPAISRLTNSMTVSVMDEQAPFQLKTNAHRFTVNQGRQILIPLELEKRQGFDNKVTLNPQGLPKKASIEFPKIEIAKGEAKKTLRMFVKENSPPGIYTAWMTSQGQVAYRRNPGKVERLKKALEEAKSKSDAAKAAQQEAMQTKEKAVATLDAAKKQSELKTNELKTAQAEMAKRTDEHREAKIAFTAAQLKAAESEVALRKLEGELLTLSTDSINSEQGQQLAEVQNKIEAAKEVFSNARAAAAEAEKQIAEPKAQLDEVRRLVAEVSQAHQAAVAAVPVAEQVKADAEAAEKAAQMAAKAAEEARKAAEKAATDAENAAKPKNTNFTPPTTPIVVEVLPAPVKLKATAANGGKVKKGETLEVTVTVKRQNNFAGPVKLTLVTPGTNGLNSSTVEVQADQTEAKFSIQATADAPDGKLQNVVVRSAMSFNGDAEVDAPLTLEVTK